MISTLGLFSTKISNKLIVIWLTNRSRCLLYVYSYIQKKSYCRIFWLNLIIIIILADIIKILMDVIGIFWFVHFQ